MVPGGVAMQKILKALGIEEVNAGGFSGSWLASGKA